MSYPESISPQAPVGGEVVEMLKGSQRSSPPLSGSPTPHSQLGALWALAPPLSTGLPQAGPPPRVLLPGGDPGWLRFPKIPEGSTPGSAPPQVHPLPRPSVVSPSHVSCVLLDFGPLRGSQAPDETVKCPLKVHGNHFQRVV